MKVVGRRVIEGRSLSDAAILQRTVRRLRGDALIPRGLYRFASHEEADTWMMRMIARTHARRSSKISSGSAAR